MSLPPTTPVDIRTFRGTPVIERETGLFKGWLPLEPGDPLPAARLQWKGRKISPAVWQRIKAFFAWSYAKTGGESQVRLFYREEPALWIAYPLPQEISRGLSTREIQTAPERERIIKMMLSNGLAPMGSGHHHCNIGAFQSGTDRNDEKENFGIHFTLGNLGSSTWTAHWRITFRGVEYEQGADLSDLVEVPDLSKPDAKWAETFCPENWKKQLMEAPPVVETAWEWSQARKHTRSRGRYSIDIRSDDGPYAHVMATRYDSDALPAHYRQNDDRPWRNRSPQRLDESHSVAAQPTTPRVAAVDLEEQNQRIAAVRKELEALNLTEENFRLIGRALLTAAGVSPDNSGCTPAARMVAAIFDDLAMELRWNRPEEYRLGHAMVRACV